MKDSKEFIELLKGITWIEIDGELLYTNENYRKEKGELVSISEPGGEICKM
jgi:hypothetical protein